MAQHDFNIANATFPSVRSDINSALTAINTTQSGTSRPSSAVAGTIWLDTTNANPTLKLYDGTSDISLATLDYTAHTVNWLDSTVSITGLSTTATATVLTLSDSANTTTVNLIIDNDKEVRFREATANGTNYIGLSAPASVSADVTFTLPVAPTANNQALVATTAGVMSFTPYAFPSADGTSGQAIVTNGTGTLSFATASITPTINIYDSGTAATYTKPTTANWILIEMWGGGGSGGKGSSANASGGGGGGGYNSFATPFSNLVGAVTYTVGAGGASQTTGQSVGNVGGNTSVTFASFGGGGSLIITAFGGGGGGTGPGGTGGAGGGGGGRFAAGTSAGNVGGADNGNAGDNTATNGGAGGAGGGVPGNDATHTSLGGGAGGGGASDQATAANGKGGNSYYAGGGGGAGAEDSSPGPGAGGTSFLGGAGGAGAFDANNATAGTLPSGGGGGSETGNSGAGGGGRIRFTYW